MDANCNHYNQDFINRMYQYPGLQSSEQYKLNKCESCKPSLKKESEVSGLLFQYQELEIQYLKNKTMVMKTLADENGFCNMVLVEFNIVKNLKTAYDNIQSLFVSVFGSYSHVSFDKFLKTLS